MTLIQTRLDNIRIPAKPFDMVIGEDTIYHEYLAHVDEPLRLSEEVKAKALASFKRPLLMPLELDSKIQ